MMKIMLKSLLLLAVVMTQNVEDVVAEVSIDTKFENVAVKAGEKAILTCVISQLGGHKVVWTDKFSTLLTYDVSRIIDDDRISVEMPFQNERNLVIYDVTYTDSGNYECQVNTKPVLRKTVTLHVLED